jgi:hypothetical protein
LIDAWRESWSARGRQPQTTDRYDQVLRTHLEAALAQRRVNTLNHEAIQRYMDQLRK